MKNNSKVFNLITWVCLVAYVFAFTGFMLDANIAEFNYSKLYENLISEAKLFNESMNYDQASANTDDLDEPLFSSATEALVFAFQKMLTVTSYESVTYGVLNVTPNAPVGTIEVKSFGHENYYTNGDVFLDTRRYETSTNFGQSKAIQAIYSNGNRYVRYGTIGELNTDKTINATYTDDFNCQGNYPFPSRYLVDEKTIVKELYFKVNRNVYTNKIESYSCSAKLNATLATKDYAKQVMIEGELLEVPVFKSFEINCLIDATGTLLTVNTKSTYTGVSQSFMGPLGFEMSDSVTQQFISFNKEPEHPEPIF